LPACYIPSQWRAADGIPPSFLNPGAAGILIRPNHPNRWSLGQQPRRMPEIGIRLQKFHNNLPMNLLQL
jgi:hypothetical protein